MEAYYTPSNEMRDWKIKIVDWMNIAIESDNSYCLLVEGCENEIEMKESLERLSDNFDFYTLGRSINQTNGTK